MKKEVGILHDNGVISWNQDVISTLYSKATFENERCLKCKHLPICLSSCTQKMKDNKCEMDYSEISYEQFIIDTYNKKIKQHETNII
jgi:uncharacterized protein